jgi:hydrogenase expression/formation protein HypC
MSLGLPGQILEINSTVAVVDFWGTAKCVRIDLLEEVVVAGDYIIEHEGFAIRRIPVEEAADTIAMYEMVLSEA